MPSWLMSAVRTAVQCAWGTAAAWLIAHNVPVPEHVPAPVVVAATAAAVGLWTGVVRWLETRSSATWRGRLARRLGRIAMLGIRRQPTGYAPPGTGGPVVPAWMLEPDR